MRKWVWIDSAVILAVHDELIAEHGGPPGVRDRGLLESALARPTNRAAYGKADHADLAACYATGIARNHPFADGNKRTAFVAVELFLSLNGWKLTAADVESVIAMLALADGTLSEAAFADWIRRHAARG